MNNFLHPDTFYEHNRQYQKERLEASQQKRPFNNPNTTKSQFKDQVFLLSGNLFIALGNNLKSRAVQPVCQPQLINVELCCVG